MMEMDKFNADWWTLKQFKEEAEQGNIELQPEYQRSRVWSDDQRYGLIDSLIEGFPIGLVMLNVIPHVEDEVAINKYDVVDGQQRIRTLLEFVHSSEDWAKTAKKNGFTPFTQLKTVLQKKLYSYKIPVALMTKFEDDQVSEIFGRLQNGKVLKPGEKLKALITSKAYPYIKEIAEHKIFQITDGIQNRDSHWMLATAFFKAAYTDDLFGRIEYKNLDGFLREDNLDEKKSEKAKTQVWKLLNYQNRVLIEACQSWPEFSKHAQTARTIKWIFIALSMLTEDYSMSGKEPAAAEGVVDYYRSIAIERSEEWAAYLNTGRTGRVDTEEVKVCISELKNRILNATGAESKDPKRHFSQSQRQEIFSRSKGRCVECDTKLSKTNFHADHTHAHSKGGKTELSNGRALCSGCNRSIGNRWRAEFGVKAKKAGKVRGPRKKSSD